MSCRRTELLERLVPAVANMRTAQRTYFATKAKSALIESKHFEYQVDALIARIDPNGDPAQPGRFDAARPALFGETNS